MAKRKPRLTGLPEHKSGRKATDDPEPSLAVTPDLAPCLDFIAPDLRPLAVPVAFLDFLPKNPRKHSEQQLARLRASLLKFGQKKPIVVNTAKSPPQVVAGNGTLAAALAMGWTHVAVSREEMTDAAAAAYAVADNELALEGEWDEEALRETLALIDADLDPQLDAMMKELAEKVQAPALGAASPDLIPVPDTGGGKTPRPVKCPECGAEFARAEK